MRFNELMLLSGVILAMGSLAVAVNQPAMGDWRSKLPTPGTILLNHDDPETLRPAMAEGSMANVIPLAPDPKMPFAKGMRVMVGKAYPTAYSVQLFSANTPAMVHKGDTVLLSCWLRAPEATGAKTGLVSIWLQTTGEKWSSLANATTTCNKTWKQVFATGTADQDFPADSLQVAMHLGQQQQVVDVAGLVLLNLGAGVDVTKLPRTKLVWEGMEPDAPWRAEAQRRIEKYRMTDLIVQVEDATGKPISGLNIKVEQQRRHFTIGSFTGYILVDNTPDGEKMRQTYLRLFNRATSPIYWADWGWPNQKTKYLAIAKWLTDNHFTTRGHVMVYPGFNYMPADVVKLKSDPQKLKQRILKQVREISEATKSFGFREYDVTNELRDCVDLHKLLGRDAVVEWFAQARKILPDAKLALNENSILTNGGVTKANQDLFLDWYNFLKSNGQTPDVLGFQAHFSEDFTAPEKVWVILDRFAKETDAELQITEFDINTLDEEAQAAYTKDFITACFAHPRITAFTMWGFWEGDHWQPRAAFWRKDWSAKPNGKMLEELLTRTWWTNTNVVTNDKGEATVKAFLGEYQVSATVDGKPFNSKVMLDQPGKTTTIRLITK